MTTGQLKKGIAIWYIYIYIYVTLKDEFFSELSNFVTLNGGGEPSWLGR